jgi:transcriptional regulator with XRE-family HTH domain
MVKTKPAYNAVSQDVLNRIREERLAQGLSLEELAERIDKSWQMLQKYETGKVSPTLDTLAKVAIALDRPLACLVKGGSSLTEDEASLIDMVRDNPQDAVVLKSTLKGLQEARLATDKAG